VSRKKEIESQKRKMARRDQLVRETLEREMQL
jgi:hypothetical protein